MKFASLFNTIGFMLLLSPFVAAAASQVKFVAELPVEKPLRLAVDSDGKSYISSANGTVVVTGIDGKPLFNLQEKDVNNNPLLKKPFGIAIDRDNIYVVDKSLDRVVIFTRKGGYVDSFGESGSGPRELKNPRGIFVNHGVVYVADYSNDRIQLYGSNGVYLGSIGDLGEKEVLLKSPTDVAVDSRGFIYGVDSSSNQVKIYQPDGSYVGKLNGLIKPHTLAVTDDGIFVTDLENSSIVKFNLNGERLYSFGSMGDGKVQFQEIDGIAVNGDGKVLVADTSKGTVQIVATAKGGAMEVVDRAPPPTSVRWVREIGLYLRKVYWDRERERLYAIDEDKEEVLVFKGDKLLQTLKLPDWRPAAVTVDRQGLVWVVDRGESRICKFDGEGKLILTFGSSGSRPGYLSKPRDMVVAQDGSVYVADTGNDRIQVFTGDGVFLNVVGGETGIPELRNPSAIAMDEKGNLYLVGSSSPSVLAVTPSGKVLNRIGESLKGKVKVEEPVAIAITGNELLVVDKGADNVKVFNLAGEFLRLFGAKGEGKGEFKKPSAVAVMDSTRFMVSDYGNKRLQVLNTVYTPAPPKELAAKEGMHSIDLRWKGSGEPFVESYRVYRAKTKAENFTAIATTSSPTYQDKDLAPAEPYFYRVGAIAREGNETVAKESIKGVPARYKSAPPQGIDAQVQEWSVDLRWDANKESYVDHYRIYREDDDEDATPQLAGQTKTTSFTEGGLDSETCYTFYVAAVSTDGVESERSPLDVETLVATKPPLQIDVLAMSNIFSNTYKIYETEGIGKVRLTNNTRSQIDSLKLSFTIKSYMDFASEVEIKDLPPQQSREVPLKAVFNNKILEVTEDTPVQTEIMVTYYENQKPRSYSTNHTITLYEKHRMMWIEKDRVATFITSKDPVLLEFARAVVTQYGEVSSPLVHAGALFDYLGQMGMTYLQHPNNPYQITAGNADFVDYVQYPRDTLKRNSGVCTDLVVLYASALESLGVKTMLLGIPGHLFMMFALGPVAELGDDTMNNMLTIHDGLIWVPVELTTVGSTFMKAWEVGSKNYNDGKAQGVIDYTDLRKAWGRYKPATLPFSDWRAKVAPRSEVDKKYNNEMARINKIALKYMSNRYFVAFKQNPNNLDPLLQIGIIYGEGGEYDEALKFFEKADKLAPKNATIKNNLGNLNFLRGNYKEAVHDYEKAAELDAEDPYILVNLAICYRRLNLNEKASAAFQKASVMNGEVAQKYRAIAMELQGGL